MKSPAFPKTFVAVDLETTSLEPQKGAIIEIGAVRFRGGVERERFTTLVNPQQKIPFLVSDITGITDGDVVSAPTIDQVLSLFSEFVGDTPIVGHNIGFDIAFLTANDYKLQSSVFDTWRLSTMAFPGFTSYSLENLAAKLKLSVESAHRAADDARVAGELFYRATDALVRTASREDMQKVVDFLGGRRWSLEEVFRTLLESAAWQPTQKREKQRKVPTQQFLAEDRSANSFFRLFTKQHKSYTLKKPQSKLVDATVKSLASDNASVFEVTPDSGRVFAALTSAFLFADTTSKKMLAVFPYTRVRKEEFLTDIKNLDQYFSTLSVEILKSPRSYLCRHALEVQLHRQDLDDAAIDVVVKVLLWLRHTKTGDLDELSVLHEQRAQLLQLTQADCAGVHQDCFAALARKRAEKSRLLITDHHTLLKWFVHDSLFRSFPALLIDEAELLPDVATFVLTQVLSQSVVVTTLEQLDKSSFASPELHSLVAEMTDATTLFFGIIGITLRKYGTSDPTNPFATSLALSESFWDEEDGKKIRASAKNYLNKLEMFLGALELFFQQHTKQSKDAATREKTFIMMQFEHLHKSIQKILILDDQDWVSWVVVQRDRELMLKKAPLRVAPFFQENLFSSRSVVLLSSGITEEGKLAYFQTLFGLPNAKVEHFGIQDHSKTTAFFSVVQNKTQRREGEIELQVSTILKVLSGTHFNALLVTPSFTSSKVYYEKLKDQLSGFGYDVFAQGVSGGRQKILEKLITKEKSLLIGSSRFFQSMNVPKERMPLVFVVKFPFPFLGDPLESAREKLFTNSFRDFMLPQALQNFRSVVNTLVTEDSSRKAIVLFDPRFASAPYKNAVLGSLPKVTYQSPTANEVALEVADWLLRPVDNM